MLCQLGKVDDLVQNFVHCLSMIAKKLLRKQYKEVLDLPKLCEGLEEKQAEVVTAILQDQVVEEIPVWGFTQQVSPRSPQHPFSQGAEKDNWSTCLSQDIAIQVLGHVQLFGTRIQL